MKMTSIMMTILLLAPLAAADDTLRLPIGDPQRRELQSELALDAITDCVKGDQITPADLPARLAGVRLLFVGESHTSIDFHRAQLRVIQQLHRRY